MNRNTAARTIQRAFRKAYPINAISFSPIKGSWYVKWFKDPKHKHFSTYAVNTFKRLTNHPETRAPKNPRNFLLVRIPGRPKTTRPNLSSPRSSPTGYSSGSNSNNNQFVRFTNDEIISGVTTFYPHYNSIIQYGNRHGDYNRFLRTLIEFGVRPGSAKYSRIITEMSRLRPRSRSRSR